MKNQIDSTQIELLKRYVAGDVTLLEEKQVETILTMLVEGTLTELDSDKVLDIIEGHEDSMQQIDSIWMDQPVGIALANTPILELEASERIRTGVVKRIRMSNTMGATVRLATIGFGSVASSLIKPLVTKNKWEPRRQRRRRRR